MSLTAKLTALMQQQGINKSQLAKETGIPYTTISSLYTKGYENIKLSTLQKLAKYFGCSLDYLVDDEVQAHWSFDDATQYLEDRINTRAKTVICFYGDEYTDEQLKRIKDFAAFIKEEDRKRDENILTDIKDPD